MIQNLIKSKILNRDYLKVLEKSWEEFDSPKIFREMCLLILFKNFSYPKIHEYIPVKVWKQYP